MGRRSLIHWTGFWAGFLDLVVPCPCQACGQDAAASSLPGLCADCSRDVPWRPPEPIHPPPGAAGPGRVVACFHEPPVSGLIHRLKYGGHEGAAVPLAGLLARAMRERGADEVLDLLVPVPMHPWKRWSRGVDHAGCLARALGRRLGLPCQPGVLRRRRLTVALAQAHTPAARAQALVGAIRSRPARDLCGARVGLVDDVLTTGATLRAADRALRRAGAGSVLGLAVTGSAEVWRLSPCRRSGSRP